MIYASELKNYYYLLLLMFKQTFLCEHSALQSFDKSLSWHNVLLLKKTGTKPVKVKISIKKASLAQGVKKEEVDDIEIEDSGAEAEGDNGITVW